MSQRIFQTGVSSVPLILTLNNNGPVTGSTVNATIIVPWNGLEFDFNDNTFKTAGTALSPIQAMTESTQQAGVYFFLWNTTSIVADTDVIVVYQSVSPQFVQDDPVSFQTSAAGGGSSIVDAFISPVFDEKNGTLTILGGIKNGESGLIVSTSATINVSDELGNLIISQSTTSTNGFHRAVFNNVQIPPNRVLIVEADFDVGASTFSTVETITVLGRSDG